MLGIITDANEAWTVFQRDLLQVILCRRRYWVFICCGLTVYPPSSHVEILAPTWWRVGSLGSNSIMRVESPWVGLVSLEEEARGLASPIPTMWGYKDMSAVCGPEEGSHQNPAMLTPGSWTSVPRLWEGNLVLPSLWCFVITAQTA